MATITVRIDDAVRDALQARAEEERQTLSDFVRDRLQDAVFAYREDQGGKGDRSKELQPETLSALDRHTLSLLHRILGRVLPDDANDVDGDKEYQLERAKVLERGFTTEYWMEFAGLRPELTARNCEFVMDVLEMFRMMLYSLDALQEDGVENAESLRQALTFDGFDHNDPLENQMSDYVRFLVQNDKWTEQEDFVLGPERGNSYHQSIPIYSRMLTEYREVKQNPARKTGRKSYLLTEEELQRIAASRIHPSRR